MHINHLCSSYFKVVMPDLARNLIFMCYHWTTMQYNTVQCKQCSAIQNTAYIECLKGFPDRIHSQNHSLSVCCAAQEWICAVSSWAECKGSLMYALHPSLTKFNPDLHCTQRRARRSPHPIWNGLSLSWPFTSSPQPLSSALNYFLTLFGLCHELHDNWWFKTQLYMSRKLNFVVRHESESFFVRLLFVHVLSCTKQVTNANMTGTVAQFLTFPQNQRKRI